MSCYARRRRWGASPRRPALRCRLALVGVGLAAGALACTDAPTTAPDDRAAPDGGVRLSVVSAATSYVACGTAVPIKATVTNATTGAPVAGLVLNFNVLAGGGSMYGGSSLTDATGHAADVWTLGSVANVANTLAVRSVRADGTLTEHYRQTVTTISRIAFVSERDAGDPEIYTQLPDGTGARRLTTTPGIDTDPAWSPDGSKIAFASYRSGTAQIYVVNADGTGLRRLTNDTYVDRHPSWSPDGTRIVFAANNRPGTTGAWGLIIVAASDGHQINSYFAGFQLGEPAWSPDGRKIAFAQEGNNWYHILVISADFTGPGQEVTNLFDNDHYPAWSPDGSKLVFTRTRLGTGELYVADAVEGANPFRLTTFAGEDLEPSWSPDGQQIVFASLRGTKYDLYSINAADGSGLAQRTTNAANDYMPSWSGCAR